MSLIDRINKIKNYFKGIEYQNGLLIIKVMFPDKLIPQGSADGLIKVTKSEGLWYYYAQADLISEDTLFDLIDATIKVYDDAKEKVALLKQKVDELRDIFATNDLETLLGLQFVLPKIEKKEDKPKRKYTRHKKNDEETTTEVVEGEIIQNVDN